MDTKPSPLPKQTVRPRCITMWDFSWIERRWPGAGYEDWPLLNWEWVKDLCRLGVETAAGTGQWVAIATSNFAGPQFHGMGRDIKWHQRANDLIKRSAILPGLRKIKLAERL